MSNGKYLRAVIRNNPEDSIGAKVYADWLQEYQGYERFAALRAAGMIRRAEINARQIQEALRLIDHHCPVSAELRDEIRMECEIGRYTIFRLVIVAGSRKPSLRVTRTYIAGDSLSATRVVTVGARWIIRRVESITYVPAPYPPEQLLDRA